LQRYYAATDSAPADRANRVAPFYTSASRISWNGNPLPAMDLHAFLGAMPKSVHEVQAFDCHPISGKAPSWVEGVPQLFDGPSPDFGWSASVWCRLGRQRNPLARGLSHWTGKQPNQAPFPSSNSKLMNNSLTGSTTLDTSNNRLTLPLPHPCPTRSGHPRRCRATLDRGDSLQGLRLAPARVQPVLHPRHRLRQCRRRHGAKLRDRLGRI